MAVIIRDKNTHEIIGLTTVDAYRSRAAFRKKKRPEKKIQKPMPPITKKINKNEMIIKKEGFLYNISADYGLIIKDTNDVYILFSNNLDAILDETKKQLPDNLYDLVLSGKCTISQKYSRHYRSIYKTDQKDFLYKIFGKGAFELLKVDAYENLFKINGSYQPVKK